MGCSLDGTHPGYRPEHERAGAPGAELNPAEVAAWAEIRKQLVEAERQRDEALAELRSIDAELNRAGAPTIFTPTGATLTRRERINLLGQRAADHAVLRSECDALQRTVNARGMEPIEPREQEALEDFMRDMRELSETETALLSQAALRLERRVLQLWASAERS